MKKYVLLFTAVAVLASCSKNEVVDNQGVIGTSTKTYSMTVDLVAGQNINVGTVSFYDPTDGDGGPLEVTYTLADGWTMSESHVYAGPITEIPKNNPGAPKIGKFPYQETHANVSSYTYYIPLIDVDMGNFAIAAHCVVNGSSNETGWASGDQTFNDKGWGTYISNFYSPANFVPNDLYAIQRTIDGSLNLVLLDANTGSNDLIYSENITGSNGTISGAAYDPVTSHLFFTLDNGLYANDLLSDNPTYLITTIGTSSISGGTFNGTSYYYYDDNAQQIKEVPMNFLPTTGWTSSGEITISPVMTESSITITDITSYNNTIYLIGLNSANPDQPVSLIVYEIGATEFPLSKTTDLSGNLDYPTIAAVGSDDTNSNDFTLYAMNEATPGEETLATISPETGYILQGGPSVPDDETNPGELEFIVRR